MSSHNEQLEPTPFEVAQPPQPQHPTKASPPNWVWPALGGLLLLAALVVFWLPNIVSTTTSVERATAIDSANGNTPAAPGVPKTAAAHGSDSTPWSDAQAAKLRKEAQDVLADLLEIQFSLEERGVTQWAAEAFSAAGEAAAAGDALYRDRQYIDAKESYRQGLTQLQALAESIPEQFSRQLEIARENIEAGNPAAVSAALQLVFILDPASPELTTLQQRADVLEALLALMEEAATAENTSDLAAAEQLLQQASDLDPQHQRARGELERISRAHLDLRFNEAMSNGYTALDDGNYSRARKYFSEASTLQGGSNEAASALVEVAGAEQASRLTTLKQRGSSLEQGEQWQQAVEAYEQAREIDGDVLFAVQGLQRSRNRARLDEQFRTAIEQPGRLSDVAVAEATSALLQQVKNINPRGPVLAKQVSQLQQLLQQANTLVTVTLRSDAETEVIIYKIARLGRFQERELSLRPGTYKARGSRVGYRDVLQSFTVSHEGSPTPVVITCSEPI